MMMRMTLGSLFDGIGGFPLCAERHGIVPVWASEIEPYPMRVTAEMFPNMEQLGDITKIDGAKIAPVDIITFGSPCQDLSIAGKQAGIHDGARSSLFFEAIRIIHEMREATDGKYPKYAVWENVPGAFSSHKGEDFRAVLEAFCAECGDTVPVPMPKKWNSAGSIVGDGFSIAWRVLDAQYWGVPQRRKRIYLVASFGHERAAEILFKRESLSWDSAQGGTAREGAAEDAAGSAGGSGGVRCLNPFVVFHCQQDTITSNSVSPCIGGQKQATVGIAGIFMGGQGAKARSIGYSEEVSPTLKSALSGGNTVPEVVYALQGNGIDRADTACCNGKDFRENESYTLNTVDRPAVVYDARGNGDGQTASTMTGGHEANITDYTNIVTFDRAAYNQGSNAQYDPEYREDGLNSTVVAKGPGGVAYMQSAPQRRYVVRRLTPLECCRLQGYPDVWNDCAEGSDSAKYKAYGNSLAIPCADYVIGRIAAYEQA